MGVGQGPSAQFSKNTRGSNAEPRVGQSAGPSFSSCSHGQLACHQRTGMAQGTTDCHFSLWGQSTCPSQVMLGPTAEKKQLIETFGVDEVAQWIKLPAINLGIHAPQIKK